MALERIAGSGIQAQLRAAENAAHNISQVSVEAPQLVSTRFEASPRGAGVRAETEPRQVPRSSVPRLDPQIDESFVREQVDIVQEFTNLLTARRAFQANVAVERASRSFVDATLNIGA